MKKIPQILCFKFSEGSKVINFLMRSNEEAKKCVSQVTRFLAMYKAKF